MSTEQLEVAEPTSDQANGHVEQTELELDVPLAPAEKFSRFADPRDETIRIVRDRLERVLQPVDDDEAWHGVNVITDKDLQAALALDLPPTSIFSAAARTPAFVYVSAVCPVCSVVSEIDLEVSAKLEVEGQSRKLKLKAKATAKPHQCGQQRLDDLAPSRPIAVEVTGDVDSDDGVSTDDVEPPEATDARAEADAVHALAMAGEQPERDQDDPFSDLPF